MATERAKTNVTIASEEEIGVIAKQLESISNNIGEALRNLTILIRYKVDRREFKGAAALCEIAFKISQLTKLPVVIISRS